MNRVEGIEVGWIRLGQSSDSRMSEYFRGQYRSIMEESHEDYVEFSKVKELDLRLKLRRRPTPADNCGGESCEDSARSSLAGEWEFREDSETLTRARCICFSKESDPIAYRLQFAEAQARM